MKRIDLVYEKLKELCTKQNEEKGQIIGFSALEIAEKINIFRSNSSSDLNKLYKENKIEKVDGKPVLYKVKDINTKYRKDEYISTDVFDEIIGAKLSLKTAVQQARAAIIYPPNGLNTLLLGETGTGKSMFAEIMHKYAKEIGRIKTNAPFVAFNCADYADNPQLLIAQLFGVKKGAYSGADKDRAGLIEKVNEGILFLDEVHRLSPEGQEMLFYLIDKGEYRRLGDTQCLSRAKVLIICATTENTESALLKTFIRRIPMIIKLPSIKKRSIEERNALIKRFFKTEADSIKSDIVVTANALKALLLYDCTNNIGQLKSDIKLCCAKAFLAKMMKKYDSVCVHSEDLEAYVLRGAFKYKECKEEIDRFVNEDIIRFCAGDNKSSEETNNDKIFNFYEALEEKRKVLESRGIKEEDIRLIMSLDIDTYLKKYILNINDESLEQLYKVVDKKIVEVVENFLKRAADKLNRTFSPKILYGLSMHVASSIERIKSGKKIENHQLEDIKKQHNEEFEVANDFRNEIKNTFNIEVAEDEAGFIAMFLCMDKEDEPHEGKVGVIIAIHGESAATSIANVSNRLLGEEHAIGYNMPLDQKPEIALENLTELIKIADKGRGVILLVDMGSLVFFGDMISERTKISIKSIDMISTPIALEATRKALLDASLEEIYYCCSNLSPYVGKIYRDNFKFSEEINKNVIITACITGEGTAVKLKNILEQKLKTSQSGIDIVSMEISNKIKFKEKIAQIKTTKNVLAVVSAIDPKDSELLYISTSDIFNDEKVSKLTETLNMIQIINNMKEVIEKNVNINSSKYIEYFKGFYIRILNSEVYFNENIIIGLILHIACIIERVLAGKEIIHRPLDANIIKNSKDKIEFIKQSLQPMERAFNISLTIHEYINLVKVVYYI